VKRGLGWLLEYGRALLNLLYPREQECPLCRRPSLRAGEAVCNPCLKGVRGGRPPFCRVCGCGLEAAGVCRDCRRRPERFFQKAVSVGPYEGRMREVIGLFKRRGLKELAVPLGEMLTETFAGQLGDHEIGWLVPVPIAEESFRVRGFNQAELLARELGKRIQVPVCLALSWKGEGRRQVARTRVQRFAGLEGALQLTKEAGKVRGAVVCLVDDVYTTGATANACARLLLEAGARAVYVLTLAR
jgi:competence protein ComFC